VPALEGVKLSAKTDVKGVLKARGEVSENSALVTIRDGSLVYPHQTKISGISSRTNGSTDPTWRTNGSATQRG
jgi:hypothetical protein